MNNTNFIKILKQTREKLKEKNSIIMSEIHKINYYTGNDPERSRMHDLWNAYRMQTEFTEFIEGLLSKQYQAGNTV